MIPNFCKTCLCRLDSGPGYCDDHRNDAGKHTASDKSACVRALKWRDGEVVIASIDPMPATLPTPKPERCPRIYSYCQAWQCTHPKGHAGQHRAETGVGSYGPTLAEWDEPAPLVEQPIIDVSELPTRIDLAEGTISFEVATKLMTMAVNGR